MFWVIALVNVGIAVVIALAIRATNRARADAAPFMSSAAPIPLIAAACVVLVAWPIVNTLAFLSLKATLSPLPFASAMIAMSIAAITFILFLQAKYVNRHASIWLRFVAPSTIVAREGELETSLTLSPNAVTAARIEEAFGAIAVQYEVRDGERTIRFAVPMGVVLMKQMQDCPWLPARSAPIMVGAKTRAVHDFLAPFCTSPAAH